MPSPACRGLPLDWFFGEDALATPDEPWSDAGPGFDAVEAVCRSCPVRAPCLSAGLREAYGVWGGLAPKERRRMRRKLGQRALLVRPVVPGT